ncbi:hypothetical protein M378DRAFT_805142 [Amanita muscaria Koide BX008]|uniref:Uncharacterized protein n=1 Tax=Amanita muscaria (strain Koide BX008) TaxID=946122 RepID=A0A0C2WKN5_AMAMK|nr:hypothetical protein M378DRAFT_805142 [Amanita muscaria Koide BX008]
MDSKTSTPATLDRPDSLAATLHNATIDKAERNEFSNTARDMFKIVLNYHQNSRSAVPTGAGQVVENPVSGPYIQHICSAWASPYSSC